MNIALIGYGKMGKVIEEIAAERGHAIVARINSTTPLADADLSSADVAIEFTRPELAVEHITFCAQMQLPVVVGTTAWTDKLPDVERMITLANGILENNHDYFSWVLGEEKEPHTNEGQLGVTSYRQPDVPGTHIIRYSSSIDTITISHEAHNRKGFALGSVIAAEWLFNKKGIFTMSDVLNLEK